MLKDRNKNYNKGVAFIQYSVRAESDAGTSILHYTILLYLCVLIE